MNLLFHAYLRGRYMLSRLSITFVRVKYFKTRTKIHICHCINVGNYLKKKSLSLIKVIAVTMIYIKYILFFNLIFNHLN